MSWRHPILAVGVLALVPTCFLRADDPSQRFFPEGPDQASAPLLSPGHPPDDYGAWPILPRLRMSPKLDLGHDLLPQRDPSLERLTHSHCGQENQGSFPRLLHDDESALWGAGEFSPYGPDLAIRFGWWSTDAQGDLTKVGEFQDLESSPFWNADMLSSDGFRTLDLSLTGTDLEGNQARVYAYRPGLSADVDYDRYLRRLDHDPLDNFRAPLADETAVAVQDDNFGESYAIRIQELKANFKGDLTPNLKWRINLWSLRKYGERQSDSVAHCFHPGDFSSFKCHALSRRQQIDWLTSQFEPVLEGRFGPVKVEYSRTMRLFNQNDQPLMRDYDTTLVGFPAATDVPYALVPDQFTQIDRLKFYLDPTPNDRFYANLFTGSTNNKFRDTDWKFEGFDLRMTHRSVDGLSLTGYAKVLDERREKPSALLQDPGGEASFDDLREPVDRQRTTAGVKGKWRAWRRQCSSEGLSLSGGYQYRFLDRENMEYTMSAAPGTFTQPDTKSHMFHTGASMRWSACWDTYARYEMRLNDYPMFGLRTKDDVSLESALNTRLPDEEHLIEIGGTWMPTRQFLLNASVGIEKRDHSSQYADFTEEYYPVVVTAWYAPAPRWSLSVGYAHRSNWIDQEITLGDTNAPFAGPPAPFSAIWNYDGQSDVVSAGAKYAWSNRLTLRASVEFVRSHNVLDTPPSPDPGVVDYSDLPGLSDVLAETTRLTAGVDYAFSERIAAYFLFNYFDYEDESVAFNSGTAPMFLGGFSGTY